MFLHLISLFSRDHKLLPAMAVCMFMVSELRLAMLMLALLSLLSLLLLFLLLLLLLTLLTMLIAAFIKEIISPMKPIEESWLLGIHSLSDWLGIRIMGTEDDLRDLSMLSPKMSLIFNVFSIWELVARSTLTISIVNCIFHITKEELDSSPRYEEVEEYDLTVAFLHLYVGALINRVDWNLVMNNEQYNVWKFSLYSKFWRQF